MPPNIPWPVSRNDSHLSGTYLMPALAYGLPAFLPLSPSLLSEIRSDTPTDGEVKYPALGFSAWSWELYSDGLTPELTLVTTPAYTGLADWVGSERDVVRQT